MSVGIEWVIAGMHGIGIDMNRLNMSSGYAQVVQAQMICWSPN